MPSNQEIMQMKAEMIQKAAAMRNTLKTKGIFIDFPAPVVFQGKSIWAFGSGLYYYPRENMTFHEGLIFVLRQILGEDKNWVAEQEALPLENRHFILRCYHEYQQWRNKNSIPANQVGHEKWAAVPDGLTKSLLSLAFDIACIIHVHGHVPKKIIERLKKTDSIYQGARYELAVAAIFSRLGCKFEFLDEKLDHLHQTPGHCEFFATDEETNTTVAVEAKSKVRKGVLHQPGQSADFQLWNNVTRPYRNALKQSPENTPFVVFVDVNSPPSPNIDMFAKPWAKEILESRKNTPLNKPGKPDPCTAIVYTNYSYHYQTGTEAKANEAITVVPAYPKFAVSELFLHKLQMAIENYSFVPNIDYDGTIQG